MARPPLLQLSGIELGYGGNPLFSGLDLIIHPSDRMALVGRNGSGKSTLMKVMAALVEPDAGQRTAAPGTHVGYMEQHPDLSGFETLGDFAIAGLGPDAGYKVEKAAAGLKLSLDTDVGKASGGERRRAALARLLAQEPELMLLDEPTNHLDIEAITWLEDHLSRTRAAFVLISHDRSFLTALARGLLWIDRGVVRRLDKGFEAFEGWRDKTWDEEDLARHKLDRKIKAEARWAVEGISARRTRNQGRLRALGDLRQKRAEMIRRQGTAAMALDAGTKSGRMVIEATDVTKEFDARAVLKPFSLRVMRGDRIAIVGPNGAGKTTLLKLLTGELAPDSGTVRHGTNLEVAVFDQNRSALDPDATLWDSLTSDPEMRVSGKADQVMVRGAPKHVVGYLKEFLFSDAQARSPVRSLSGGEKARLLLARIMARSSNLLILDEPTNDLDIETLDLLQEILSDYPGTVIVVSHDRDFIDRVASTTVFMPGDGSTTAYAGGWTDMLVQRGTTDPVPEKKPASVQSSPRKASEAKKPAKNGLSFTETHRLNELPAKIERLEEEIRKLSDLLADPDLYTREPAKFKKATEALAQRQQALSDAEEDWLDLENRASS